MKKNGKTVSVLLMVACLLLIMGNLIQGLFCGRLKMDLDELQNQKEQYQDQNQELLGQLEELSEKVKKLNDELTEKNTALEDAQAQILEMEQEKDGMLLPQQSDSVFAEHAEISNLAVGDIISYDAATENMDVYFSAYTIQRDSPLFLRINGKSYRDNPNIALEELRYLRILHYNFNHEIQVGEMIVNARIQEDVLSIFEELFWEEYEIQSVRLIDDYWIEGKDGNAADYASIEVNNTSAFNYRDISGGSKLSKHAYGLAIDINPQQNPYVTESGHYSHENATPYIDRGCGHPAVIVPGDICYNTFEKYGFSWGGNWSGIKDYQHFQIDG